MVIASAGERRPLAAEEARLRVGSAGHLRPHDDVAGLELLNRTDLDGVLPPRIDRKSTRLNSSHPSTSYAVLCLKKKNQPLFHPASSQHPRILHRPVQSRPEHRRRPRRRIRQADSRGIDDGLHRMCIILWETSIDTRLRIPSHLEITIPKALTCITRFFFFFNDTAPTEIYTLSLHDALPI